MEVSYSAEVHHHRVERTPNELLDEPVPQKAQSIATLFSPSAPAFLAFRSNLRPMEQASSVVDLTEIIVAWTDRPFPDPERVESLRPPGEAFK